MVVAAKPGVHDTPWIAAICRPDWFFDRDELRRSGAEVAVFDLAGRTLFHSFDLPDTAPLMACVLQQPASGTTEWISNGEPHLVRYWRAFLRPQ
ncbi:MAG: hypothetical protein ABIP94_06700 [Planctomycetota bacterium]